MVGTGLGWIGMLREEGSVALRGIKTLPAWSPGRWQQLLVRRGEWADCTGQLVSHVSGLEGRKWEQRPRRLAITLTSGNLREPSPGSKGQLDAPSLVGNFLGDPPSYLAQFAVVAASI